MSATVHIATTPAAGRRYTLTAQALHWVTAALIFVALPLAWVAVNMPKDASSRGLLFTLHKSVGLTILALAAARLFWRALHPAPPLRDRARWEAAAAFASHWLLYLVLIAMPVSGYLLSAGSGRPVSYFGLFSIPGMPKSEALDHAATWTHVAVGQWAVYTLVVLHIAATAWHVAVRRDGTLERMLPPQETE
jgi:cytochrome b561